MSGARFGFIGGGKMGGGMIRGLIERGVAEPAAIVVCEPVEARRDELRRSYGVETVRDYAPALAAEVVVLSVKPQDFVASGRSMADDLSGDPLLVSILAGVRLGAIQAALPVRRAVRVMPNLGATVGESFSTWYAPPTVDESDRRTVRTILAAIGREAEVSSEAQVDMATAVAGSGPGFVALIMEALVDGAVTIGLPRALATEMVVQTVLGTARWAREDGGEPADLRGQVMSPGGTTAAGVVALERGGLRATLIDAVIAAFEKSKALGRSEG